LSKEFVLPGINLMHCLVIDVRGSGLSDVEAIGNRFRCLPKVLLLVAL
jgi:hypothetical protein